MPRRAGSTPAISDNVYRRLLDLSPEGAFVEVQDRIVFANRALARLLGCRSERELIGRHVLDIVHPESRAAISGHMRRHSRKPGWRERKYIHADGSAIPIEGAAVPFYWKGRRAFLVAVRDLTERRWLQKDVQEIAEREQRRIGRDLHDGVGRELIALSSRLHRLEVQLRARGAAEADDVVDLHEHVLGAVSNARKVARDLLDLPLSPKALAERLNLLAKESRKAFGLDVRAKCDPNTPLHGRQAAQLFHIAQEALNNALQHSGAQRIRLALRRAGRNVELAIEDDGAGFSEQPREGGLGLRTMEYRAGLIGGSIRFERPKGHGTRVVCFVPAAPKSSQKKRRAPIPA
jgi:PAS domain S-box-containing protein